MRRFAVIAGVLVLLLGLSVVSAVSFGAQAIDLSRALGDPTSMDGIILWSARAPRVALAALAGGALAVVGVALQALLRNPLADPYVLGVSGGAAAGATLAIVAGASAFTAVGAALVPAAALAGGLVATLLVYGIARAAGEVSGTTIILAGVIVNATFSSLITFVKTLVSAAKAQELLFWLMGFLDVPSSAQLGVCALWVAVGLAIIMADAGRLNLLALGREPAEHLGVNVKTLERRVFFAASAIAGAVVSLTGLIGFVGLIVPHAARRLLGPDHRSLVPAAMLLGAATLVACDLAARVAFLYLGTEPPVGAVTALIGGPLFLVILYRTRARRAL
ncbi:MAG: iron ABC transporter permease [Polyangiaceae bacterium]